MKLNKIKKYNSVLFKNKKINASLFFFLILLVTNACEPDPKMISYGNNDFKIAFENTSWDDRPLHEGYFHSWAGENFSLVQKTSRDDYGALVNEFICKGDNSMGQCDLPVELNDWISLYGYNQWNTS